MGASCAHRTTPRCTPCQPSPCAQKGCLRPIRPHGGNFSVSGSPKFHASVPTYPSLMRIRHARATGRLLRLGELLNPPERCLLVSSKLHRRSPAAAQQRRGQGARQRASELPPPPVLPPRAGRSTQRPRRAQGALLREAADEGRAPLAPIARRPPQPGRRGVAGPGRPVQGSAVACADSRR